MVLDDALHERLAQSCLQGGEALHGGWQLAVVAGKDDAAHAPHGNPAGGFESLGGFVDKQGAELLAFQQSVGRAYEGTGDDTGFAEELGIDAHLEFGGALLQSFQFLVVALVTPFAVAPDIPDGLADAPEQLVVGVCFEASLVGEAEHLVIDAGWIADAEHVEPAVDKLFRYPVDGHVALGADEHLTLPSQCLIDGFHEGGGLARAGRPVYDGHILGPEHLVDGILLRLVQVREVHWGESEGLGLHPSTASLPLRGGVGGGIEEVSQVGEPSFRPHHAVEGLEHHLIAGLVEEKLYAHILGSLHVDELAVVGHGDDHAVALDIADGGGEGEVVDRGGCDGLAGFSGFSGYAGYFGFSRYAGFSGYAGYAGFPGYLGFAGSAYPEKGHWPSELEVVLYLIVVALAEYLHDELVERVVVALAHADGIPCITALHLPLQSHLLGLLAVGFLFCSVLHLEQ